MTTREIIIKYAEKVGLPNYSNSLVEMADVVVVNEDEDAAMMRALKLYELRAEVRAEVDRILEANGRRAKYDDGPRCKVLKNYPKRNWIQGRGDVPVAGYEPVVIILPDDADPKLERFSGYRGADPDAQSEYRFITYRHARQLADDAVRFEACRLIDCADGDFSRIPAWALTPLQAPEPEPAIVADPADKRTRFVGLSEFEALAQDDDEDDDQEGDDDDGE